MDRKSVYSFDIDSLDENYHKISPLKDETLDDLNTRMQKDETTTAASTSSNMAQVLQGDSKNVTGYDISQGHSGLQHSGEFHDVVFLTEPKEDKQKDDENKSKKVHVGLQHSGEMHDSIGFVDFDDVDDGEDGDDEDDEEEPKLEHTGEMHDTIDIFLSSEELSQGQVYVIIVSCLTRYISFINLSLDIELSVRLYQEGRKKLHKCLAF